MVDWVIAVAPFVEVLPRGAARAPPGSGGGEHGQPALVPASPVLIDAPELHLTKSDRPFE
ncbi:hypothetical protein JOD54_003328 [Actinokineospora baliensis]|uniref:hypothetical protein n=1 Tax=Actinokineospora baliensis TaxID=547056 RepID=UPI00195E8A3B|nr:hypothetical protein [Actinokineospora baliensis]MBM7773124.1 hypothetical protein [Actinokineospora baliensis]